MKVTYNWLKDFVEIKAAPHKLADKLTMAGLEVTSLGKRDGDFVFEIEVTANRPDCLSVIGIAREIAAITGKKLKDVSGIRYQVSGKNGRRATGKGQPFSIKIEDRKDCPFYTAKIIKDVKVGPSPDWLRKRLELVGCRSINNTVDITNYILLEWGEPLHAFDLDKLRPDAVIVRRARKDEKIVTIDGEQRMLNPDILVIADKERPVAIAGIMGGKETEVTEKTKNILLEAAVFNPILIRRIRQVLGVSSESAYRFERGVDIGIVESASLRAAQLIQTLNSGRCVLAKSSGLPKRERKRINLEVSSAQKILGVRIAPAKIKQILSSLGFLIKIKPGNKFSVSIPSYRPDVNLEVDLIEEIARLFGYEKIPQTLHAVKPQATVCQVRHKVTLIKSILTGLGLNEAITYSLIAKDAPRIFDAVQGLGVIEILNPLSKEQEILRPSTLSSLAACVAYNLNQKEDYINLFEVAKVFLGTATGPKEELVLGIALCGIRPVLLEQGLIKEEVGFLHLKGILAVLFERLGIKNYNFNPEASPFTISIYVDQEKIGVIASLERAALEKFEIKNKAVFVAELSLDKLFPYTQLQKRFLSLPKYPGITRDISFIVREGISIKEILEAMQREGRPLLANVKIADYYKGKQIPPGYRGLTISCLYRSGERTLTEAEINPLHSLILDILIKRFGAKMR